MHTSFGVFALASFLLAPSPTPSNVVWRDYHVAQDCGVKEQKPLAVFVGTGQKGYQNLTGGKWDDKIAGLLAEHYVCVYLDTAATGSPDLVQALAITRGQGLVLSDRTGYQQAFHHDGPISPTELAKQLRYFSAPDLPLRTTISNVNQRASYYPASTSNGGSAVAAPAIRTRNC